MVLTKKLIEKPGATLETHNIWYQMHKSKSTEIQIYRNDINSLSTDLCFITVIHRTQNKCQQDKWMNEYHSLVWLGSISYHFNAIIIHTNLFDFFSDYKQNAQKVLRISFLDISFVGAHAHLM